MHQLLEMVKMQDEARELEYGPSLNAGQPCPFCGSLEIEVDSAVPSCYIFCGNCGLQTGVIDPNSPR